MTDQTIPAEKVREVIEHFERKRVEVDNLEAINLLRNLKKELLPTPPQPTTGLLGRWAKHPEHGDVLCMWDKPSRFGKMRVAHVSEGKTSGAEHWYAEFDSLTFPHQTTRPEDVQPGEAWLVDVEDSEESHKSIVALKYTCDDWRTSDGVTNCSFWEDTEVTLISPLTPERPGTDLQARYDELDKSWCYLDGKYSTLREDYDALEAKYREAQEKIKTLEQPSPVWRIEHDWRNLRGDEYIIDSDDDTGTVTRLDGHGHRDTDGTAYGFPGSAPFIAFPNKAAATPEAIEEAKRARDKETGA